MSDMTIEKAHLELNLHRSDGPDCGCLNCAFAWGFLEGAASRDPEVAELQAELDMHKTAKYAAREASRKLVIAAERAVKLLPCGGPEMRPCYCCDLKDALKTYGR